MKIKNVKSLKKATYSYETSRLISDANYWDLDLDFTVNAVEGSKAMKLAEYRKIKIAGPLSTGVYYAFHWNRNKTCLIPIRVSMAIKTIRNYNNPKGILKYRKQTEQIEMENLFAGY